MEEVIKELLINNDSLNKQVKQQELRQFAIRQMAKFRKQKNNKVKITIGSTTIFINNIELNQYGSYKNYDKDALLILLNLGLYDDYIIFKSREGNKSGKMEEQDSFATDTQR